MYARTPEEEEEEEGCGREGRKQGISIGQVQERFFYGGDPLERIEPEEWAVGSSGDSLLYKTMEIARHSFRGF